MKIFLLAGKARSGKHEVAKCIKNYYNQIGQKTIITEYSKYLKLYAKEMTGWNGLEPKPRKFLQNMGTFIRRKMNMPDFLINRMLDDLRIYEKFFDIVVISDIRFVAEITSIKNIYSQALSVYIINEHGDYDLTKEQANHETEHGLDDYNDFDYMIVNDKKELLMPKMAEILGELE